MKITWKMAVAALALTAGATAAMPASAQSFGLGFGPRGGISFSYHSGGYCDQFGCPDDFWQMPIYYGPVFWHGDWYDGPVYYREAFGHRQFWIHGDWRNDEWRGPHPGWWREGRFGPPLGVDYYRSHGFHGRWDRGGYDRRDDRREFDRRGDDRGFDRHDDRGDRGHRDDRGDRGGFNRNDNRGGGPQPQAQPQQGRGGPGNNPPAAAPGAPPAGAPPGDRHHDRDH